MIVQITDTGIGITPSDLPHIFNAFEQGRTDTRRFGGLGLGLAISQSIVGLHHGEIFAHSEGVGKGATFTVILKVTSERTSTERQIQDTEVRPMRLLLVEDHGATLDALTRFLTRDGHQVTALGTIHDALAAARDGHFDLLISDLGLPDGSGIDLMRELRKHQTISGIVLSGYGTETDERKSRDAGFFAHLVKPVNISQLRNLLAQASKRLN